MAPTVRSYRAADRQRSAPCWRAFRFLYPGAARWLARRLDDVEADRAHCWVADADRALCGVLIATPKERWLKRSTIFVAPAHRGRGLGRALVEAARALWQAGPWPAVVVTVAPQHLDGITALLGPLGFEMAATLGGRYGRDELVLVLDLGAPVAGGARPAGA